MSKSKAEKEAERGVTIRRFRDKFHTGGNFLAYAEGMDESELTISRLLFASKTKAGTPQLGEIRYLDLGDLRQALIEIAVGCVGCKPEQVSFGAKLGRFLDAVEKRELQEK